MKPVLCVGSLVVVCETVFGEYQQALEGDVGRFLGMDGPYACVNFSGLRKTIHPSFLICLSQEHWLFGPSAKIIHILEAFDKVVGGDPLKVHELGIRNQLSALRNHFEKYGYTEAKIEIDGVVELLDIYPYERPNYPALPRYFRMHLGVAFLHLLCPVRPIETLA